VQYQFECGGHSLDVASFVGVNGVSDADAKNRKVSSEDFSPASSSKEVVTTHQTSEKNQLRDDKIRFALVVSHPIQHFTPFYRALAQCEGIVLKVFFCCRVGLEPYFDREMNTQIAWNMDLLSGYDHMFLPEASEITRSGPLKIRNPSVGEELAKFDPQVVLTHGYNQLTMLFALWWCRRNKVPAMLIGDSELLHQRRVGVRFAKRVLLPLLLSQYKCFLTTGDNNEAYYAHYGVDRRRFFRSPFTIDEANYRAAADNRAQLRQAFRQAHGIGPDEFVVLTVGKLSDRKRPYDLLAVAETLKSTARASPPFHIVYAGDGANIEDLRTTVAAKKLPVTLLGFVNVDRLAEVYCAADILAHPSELDPHPLVLSEAACVGLPLLISDRVGAAGPTDIAREGENAVVYPCGDVRALADALLRLGREPETVERMSKASLRIFRELDTRKSVAGALAAIEFCREA